MRSAPSHSGVPRQVALARGFADPVLGSQHTFRAVMSAMAEPGTIHSLSFMPVAPGLMPAMTALGLTLLDFETSLWCDASEDPIGYLRFHTGATPTSTHREAHFAFITRPAAMPPPATFRQGTLDYPDTSCTLVVEVAALDDTGGWTLTGPGIRGSRRLAAPPLGDPFLSALVANRKAFPLGVDVILCSGSRIAALPRSTTLMRAEGR